VSSVRVLVVSLVALVVGGASAVHAQPDPAGRAERAARLRSMGQAYLAAGDAGSATAYFRDAIATDRDDAESYVLLGEIYLERGRTHDALAVISAGVRQRPDHGPLWRSLARGLETDGQLDEAARALRELTTRVPDDYRGHYARAELARRRRAHAEAQASYRAVIDLAAGGAAVPEADVTQSRRYVAALGVLLQEVDPVGGADRCTTGSVVRIALARCDNSGVR
jgi:Tfp pilus assembly protein PilF